MVKQALKWPVSNLRSITYGIVFKQQNFAYLIISPQRYCARGKNLYWRNMRNVETFGVKIVST